MRLCPTPVFFASTCLLVGLAGLAAADPPAAQSLDPRHAEKMAEGLKLFRETVRPVLVGRCLKCHGGEETESEFDLSSRAALLEGGAGGPAVELGSGKTSWLYQLIAHIEEPFMPADGARLDERFVQAIEQWIDLGAPYDKPLLEDEPDPLAWTQRRIDGSQRDFWSFQPLARVSPPAVDADWIRSDIDRFLWARLAEQQLTPGPLATRRTLIRRAYFDLIGLPPSPQELAEYLQDPDPWAYEKLIDRLLNSPHYGERWGRHWLDVARFAESHGFEQDYDRPHAYHYRDFVIQALNRDMPYDQFVRWQLAGDEIAPQNSLAMQATGFLGAGVFPTQLTEKEFEPARYDELDDMAATLGTAMLGLTIGCARCHDHKYDPIPQADYYRFISTFTTTIRSEVELDLEPERSRQALAQWTAEHAALLEARGRYEREQLPARWNEWLSESQPGPPAAPWLILDPVQYTSQGGATLVRLDDGSLLAGGRNPDSDTYVLTARTQQTGITAVRLEALGDDSLPKGGPGRAENGNFGLSRIQITAQPLDENAEATKVLLAGAQASFQQNEANLAINGSIDGDPKTGWAVDPQVGKDHVAVFRAAAPFGFPGGTQLTIKLEFEVNTRHSLGRYRLAIATAADPPEMQAGAVLQNEVEIARLLERSDGEPDDALRGRLLSWFARLDPAWQKLDAAVRDHVSAQPQSQLTKVMVTSEGLPPIPHHADARGFPHFYPQTYFLNRGDTSQKQGVAEQGFLQVLMPQSPGLDPWSVERPDGARTSYRRRALASWITDTEDGAGQLLARVIVNRLWQHHLGRGIVATPNDFGFQGQRPTHPQLLDWLAAQLIENGWRLKPLHKLIMTSAVYMQESSVRDAAAQRDAENHWWWRYEPRRLEAEIIRDAMLSAGGQLDTRMFGPGTLDPEMKRRSIYFMVKRSQLIPMMQIFDAPEPLVSVGDRPSTTIAPQALMFMNNPQVRSCAAGFAERLEASAEKSLDPAIEQGYLIAIARPPTDAERRDALGFVQQQMASYAADQHPDPRRTALLDFCQVLMSLNEFVFVD